MDDQPNQPEEPGKEGRPFPKMVWLCLAFVPSVIAIACLKMNNSDLLPIPIILNFICSIVSGFGLIRGIKNKFAAFFLGLFLVLFFLLANAFIVIFVGCSEPGGRIAP
jgi:hypothetical protein